DVGCGAGFPSLPLAIVRPDLTVTASDATAKKTAFVAMAAERLGLSHVRTLTGRAEELARTEHRDAYDVATARAVAALPTLLELCVPFIREGGLFLGLKGRSAMQELEASRHAIGELKCKVRFTKEYEIGEGDAAQARGILLLEKLAPTPATYPRAYARMKSRPL
ncbi:MAG: 16S rRNA (guanine(527)-N(7))-methyltransferase RsmG, partial [Clostridia bacterium]|nr:16S rRNA (guanine(527)-N(7))-methyltransferase RsmG [Clostridia bacterium]